MVSKEVGAPLRVIELFAGVGGFRLGLEGLEARKPGYRVVWSNQWEPSTKRQHASDVYTARWGAEGHSNQNIFDVVNNPSLFQSIVDSKPDVLVGGFPCQDYSVAKPAEMAAGIEGKKGVLWWAIHRCLKQLVDARQPVKYLVLENVDRLLKSPTANRGRDMAIILASLAELGYAVEWRVVNAADYGFPQRRKRIFLVGYHSSTSAYATAEETASRSELAAWLSRGAVLAHAFPADLAQANQGKGSEEAVQTFEIGCSPLDAQVQYVAAAGGASQFLCAGLMLNGRVWTADMRPKAIDHNVERTGRATCAKPSKTLGEVVARTLSVPPEFFIDDKDVPQWRYLKGAKAFLRTAPSGYQYKYSEGAMVFPDALDRPSRTIITAEGGRTASRFKHVVETTEGQLRRLVPEELEELNGFPRGFTDVDGVSDVKRAFLMGNALVVGIVERIGSSLASRHASSTVAS